MAPSAIGMSARSLNSLFATLKKCWLTATRDTVDRPSCGGGCLGVGERARVRERVGGGGGKWDAHDEHTCLDARGGLCSTKPAAGQRGADHVCRDHACKHKQRTGSPMTTSLTRASSPHDGPRGHMPARQPQPDSSVKEKCISSGLADPQL